MSDPPLAFIGAGNMASAIIGGLVAKGYASDKIWAADPAQDCLQRLKSKTEINVTTDNNAAIAEAEVVVLAVKPQVMAQIARQIQSSIQRSKPLIISIAAGITISSLQRWLGDKIAIVRCMPNTPALVQSGASALFANCQVTEQQGVWANELLQAVGLTCWVDSEDQLDAVTALSGSGPAYFFLVMEAMIKAAESMGLSTQLAQQLTLQTASGATKMAQVSDVDVAELRRRVTSPGGTTEAALGVFEQGSLGELFEKALQAAERRSRELALELGD